MNNTLTNGFRLVEALASSGQEMSVKELAEQFGLPASHVCRLLKTLCETGHVEQQAGSRKYQISLKILTLAHERLANMDLRKKGRSFMGPLAEELGCPVYLSAPWRGHSIIIDVVYPASCSVDAGLVIGTPHVINHSACGKICAAFADKQELEFLTKELAGVESTTAIKSFLTELESIRQTRFAMRCENGHNAAAVPVFRSGGIFCGALGVHLPADFKWTSANRENCRNSLKKHSDALSFALGMPFSS